MSPAKRPDRSSTDDAVGVTAGLREDLQGLAPWVKKTFDLNPIRPALPLGYYANVLPLTPELAIAISTDGVGTKILVAEMLEKYDTVGIDCVAMNANDILCVGARPISMVDYIAVERAEPGLLGELAKGLYAGAEQAGVNIPAGEIAQVSEMIRGAREGSGFDLVGTCIGTVHPERLIVGRDVRPGDAVVGIASSGIHSNGLTLARHVLFERARLRPRDELAELGTSVGAAMLEPTRIYVKEVVRMLDAGLAIKALLHLTGDGFLNLTRVVAEVGYVIDALQDEPPIFSLLRARGEVSDAEMFRVYNMGTGFCVVVDPSDAERVVEIATAYGHPAAIVGYTVADAARRVWIPQKRLVGRGSEFRPSDEAPPPRPA
jgi:phosphoribosylformylglycinamidine cyclo-ligase